MNTRLEFEIDNQRVVIEVSDEQDFIKTLRSMQGISGVSVDRSKLQVTLNGKHSPLRVVAEVCRIYPQARRTTIPAPRPR